MAVNKHELSRMNLFIELLQVSLGTRDTLSRVPTPMEWEQLFEEAENQAIVGVLLEGLQRCMVHDEGLMINLPIDLKLQWIGEVQIIEQQNRVVSKACREVVNQFEKDGFKCCVLKGQANLRYYPEEMRLRRSSGDVDVWVKPVHGSLQSKAAKPSARFFAEQSGKAERKVQGYRNPVRRTLEYVEREHELTGLCWLHCNFDYSEEVPVEVHFRPSFMNEPLHNHRLQRWFGKIFNDNENLNQGDSPSDPRERSIMGAVPVDSVPGIQGLPVEVDVVYQMNHIYRHLLDEGVGLRQIVDYFFLLRKFSGERFLRPDGSKRPEVERAVSDDTMKVVSRLGMKRFAGALMYVMREVCGMSDEELLCEPNEKDGKFLLNEIMTAGNFGQADPRMEELNTSSVLKRQVSQAWRRFKRNLRFVTSYPGEVIWEPVARMEHFAWKKLRLWRV